VKGRVSTDEMKHKTPILIALLLLPLPSVAYANAGTPLIWAGILHLAVGNLVIGIVEGALLAWLFKALQERAIVLLVLVLASVS
jgi:hypothetical protein